MGCAQSRKARGDVILPAKTASGGLTSVTPGNATEAGSESSAAGVPATATDINQGLHWAENASPTTKRDAQRAWDAQASPGTRGATPVGASCMPCGESAASSTALSAESPFEFKCTFPMMVMKMETFMKLDKMLPYEKMIETNDVFEWQPEMGRVFFLSHQWTSFSHPDPESEQLCVAQTFLGKVGKGQLRSLFSTEEEWLAFHYKESNRFFQFDVVTEEGMADDVNGGYVWLDYASVPQAVAAEEARLRAIDSIPFYVDHALCFLVIVPKIEHKDLPGTFCTFQSWQSRGWCRLETQVHELRLFIEKAEEMMPGVPKIDLPRRPLIVHSGAYATTYDLMDNFYMNWQRKSSIFTGEFACCRLGHKRKGPSGEMLTVSCDKTRIRPLVRSLWERKCAHLATMPPFVRFLFHWRWASHTDMMMSDFVEDTDASCDPSLATLADMSTKYLVDETHRATFNGLMPMLQQTFVAHPSMQEPAGSECTGGSGDELKPQMLAWFDKWMAVAQSLESYQVAWATCYAVAEGNLRMLETLHREHGADLTLGFSWGITLLDFAACKGHTRIINYLLDADAVGDALDKPSFRERITAVDRACKAGMLDVLDLLVERGAHLHTRRLNRQAPAHGAAIMGQTHILQRLHELGVDLVASYDADGRSPLDYATYYCHKLAEEFLRGLHGGRLTRYEESRLVAASVKMQAIRRGVSGRKEVAALRAMMSREKAKPAAPPAGPMGIAAMG